MKRDPASVQFTYERVYTLRRPKFKLFKNVQYLDAAKLSRGSHTIELGKFEGCHCGCAVTATVSNGMVRKINYPKCEGATKIPPGLAKKIEAARKRLRRNGPPKWVEIPVQRLVTGARAGIIIIITPIDDCIELCVDTGSGLKTCWICCGDWCIGPSDPQARL